eukprot:TRINITY_DN13050_c0_g1_i1.p1 TRINITY_DN13050_c0_g1~~TRINITY_DN13050_c0_g1_i1.p1  ORF type:complete len:131 (-),score=15.87 TRINITY_DN13050_c0_g1_i1:84-476(-)
MGITSSIQGAMQNAMGNMAKTMKEVQSEAQAQMMENQRKNQQKMMETQRGMAIAMARDNVLWLGGVWSTLTTVAVVRRLAGNPLPTILRVPIVTLGIATAYTWDMAYGTKMRRIQKHLRTVLDDQHEMIE